MSTPDPMPPAAVHLGRSAVEGDLAHGPATVRFVARPEFTNRHGGVQGGFLVAMLDSATGAAVMAGLPPELTAVTTSVSAEFLKPAKTGAITATVSVTARDDRDVALDCQLTDETGTVVVRGKASYRIRRRAA